MSRVVIEPASPRDAPEIAQICRDEIELGLGWRWRAGAVARMISRPDTEVAIARDSDGHPAGFGILELGPSDGELILFAVAPDARRRGIGRELLGFLESEARVAGIESIWLHVRARNAGGIAFYEQAGYVLREHLPGHYGGREDGLRMQHRLVPAVVEASDVPDLGALLRGGR